MDLGAWAWLIWLALAVVFAVIEVFTLDLLFAMLAVGSLGGMVTAFAHGPVWLQVVIAAVLAILLVFTLRPPLLRRLRANAAPVRHNVDAITGLIGVVASPSTVKLANGETWSAKAAGAAAPLSPGDRVLVVAVTGATVEVVPEPEEA